MAQANLIIANQPIQAQQFPSPGPDYFGRPQAEAADFTARMFQRIQDAEDISESRRIVAETAAKMNQALKVNSAEIADPDEFESISTDQIKAIHDDAIEQAKKNSRQQRLVKDAISNDLINAETFIQTHKFEKKKDIVKANFDNDEKILIEEAASEDPNKKAAAFGKYLERTADLRKVGVSQVEIEKRLREFNVKAITRQANNELEADPSLFLRNLGSGKYDDIDSDLRLRFKRSANAAISSAITIQERDQKVRREQADRDLQVMFDKGAPSAEIDAKLKELSAAGILTRTERDFWDKKLLKDEKTDQPVQAGNAKALKAEFDGAGYPTAGRVAQYRARAASMLRSGDLGTLGWGEVNAYLSRVEQSLRSEGRAIESADRARTTFNERGGGGKPPADKDISKTDALDLIKQNYSYGTAANPIHPQHKKDVAEFANRTLINGERRDVVAKEIFQRGEKKKTEAAAQTKAQGEAAQADPVSKEILDRLKAMKGGK